MYTDSEFKAANLSLYSQRNNSPLTIWATLTDLYALWNVFLLSLTFSLWNPQVTHLPALRLDLRKTSITVCRAARGHGDDTTKRWVTSAQLLHLLQWVRRFLVGFLMTDVHQTEKLLVALSVLISYRLFLSAHGALLSRNISYLCNIWMVFLTLFAKGLCGTRGMLSVHDYKKGS